MQYKFMFKKGMFWKTFIVVGHNLVREEDRMILYFADGSIFGISEWHKYDIKLGTDWVVAQKKMMEKESGQQINLNI